jgi:hypothetical protein
VHGLDQTLLKGREIPDSAAGQKGLRHRESHDGVIGKAAVGSEEREILPLVIVKLKARADDVSDDSTKHIRYLLK